jgi:hypothetical protein
MSQHVYDMVAVQYTRSLKNMKGMLLKAREFAKERNFDENHFLSLKAAPDMFTLARQVQITTDMTKAAAARLAGKTAPAFEDNETTLEELLTRLDKTISFMYEMKPADYANYAEQKYTSMHRKGQFMSGKDFLESHNIPNVYFHMTTTYLLLRSCGVNIGKKDYIGDVNWQKE